MNCIERMQEAIREERLDGWLFCNFAHRDRLTDSILALDPNAVSSRRWFYLVPASGDPAKVVHAIERGILDTLPGTISIYSGKDELVAVLSRFHDLRVAVLADRDLQVLSTMDAASLALIESCGMRATSAATLIQRIKGLLDAEGVASHERAADILYGIVEDAWRLVQKAFSEERALYEGDIQDFMMDALSEAGLVTDHPPIVAAGRNSANPHYAFPQSPAPRGARLERGNVVQFDIWAKEPTGIYADISWIGYVGAEVPGEISRRANLVFEARDLVKPAIEDAARRGAKITGAELDAIVRSFLLSRSPKSAIQHRTGHGIDTDCHGSGVNIDSFEFPDHRALLEGSCFSIEPGLYFEDYGFRTEIDIYIRKGRPVISGRDMQRELLTLEG